MRASSLRLCGWCADRAVRCAHLREKMLDGLAPHTIVIGLVPHIEKMLDGLPHIEKMLDGLAPEGSRCHTRS